MFDNLEEIAPDVVIADRPCFTRGALAKALGKSHQTIAGWKTRGFGPAYLLIGRQVVYPQDEVIRWLDSRLITPSEQKKPRKPTKP